MGASIQASAVGETRRGGKTGAALFALAVILLTCAVNAINSALPISTPSNHAVENHGSDAWAAINWLEAHPQTRHRIDCPGGHPIWYDVMDDGRVATVVTTGGAWDVARNVTAMLLSQKHFERFVRKCGGVPPLAVGISRKERGDDGN